MEWKEEMQEGFLCLAAGVILGFVFLAMMMGNMSLGLADLL